MNHMNLLPLDSHGVDFSRVRMWSLNNWSKYYRQTLLFGALQDAQINSVFNKYCVNVQGQVGSPLLWTFGKCHVLFGLRSRRGELHLISSGDSSLLMRSLTPGRWPWGTSQWQAPSVRSWCSSRTSSRGWKRKTSLPWLMPGTHIPHPSHWTLRVPERAFTWPFKLRIGLHVGFIDDRLPDEMRWCTSVMALTEEDREAMPHPRSDT